MNESGAANIDVFDQIGCLGEWKGDVYAVVH
jgi:hypothetical protein